MSRAIAILLLCSVAHAQPAPPAPEDSTAPTEQAPTPTPAEQAFTQGRTLLEAGKFAEACSQFETSLKLDASAPGTLLNLGLCNERLGRTATALMWFRRAQVRAAETGMTDYEGAAKDNTLSLSVRVPVISLAFEHPPAKRSVITIDGRLIEEVDYGRIELDPHVTHVIELQTGGRVIKRKTVTLEDGGKQKVVVDASDKPASPKARVVDHGRTRRLIAYGMTAAGVAMWGASLGVSLAAKHERDQSSRPEDWLHAQQLARWGGTSLFLAGAITVGAAGYLYFTAPGTERIEPSRTALVPVVGPESVGVMVHGGF